MRGKSLLPIAGALLLLFPSSAFAVTVSRAELNSGRLKVEGRAAASAPITVTSTTSRASGTSDGAGNFRVEASSFQAADCKVTVSDGGRTANATATLSGCTVSSPPTSPPPPSSTCTLNPREAATYNVGDLQTFYWTTTGCRTSEKPVQFNKVSGTIPPGMDGPFTQGVGSGFVTGRPTTVGTFTFTIRGVDFTGASDTETYTIRVDPARPVTITTPALSDAVVGQFYCCGNLFADGGTPGYTWTLRAGTLPPGLNLQASPGRITGTPTVAGSFTFTVRATDTKGAFAEKAFTINVT